MQRYQVGYCVLERAEIDEQQLLNSLKAVGARNPRLRYVSGWSNQPKTPTFSAETHFDARGILRDALRNLGSDEYPSCYEIPDA